MKKQLLILALSLFSNCLCKFEKLSESEQQKQDREEQQAAMYNLQLQLYKNAFIRLSNDPSVTENLLNIINILSCNVINLRDNIQRSSIRNTQVLIEEARNLIMDIFNLHNIKKSEIRARQAIAPQRTYKAARKLDFDKCIERE